MPDQSLRVGSRGPLVDAWVRTMNSRFASYSRRADGSPLVEDGVFGLDDARVADEWHRRVGRPVFGDPWTTVVSEEELCLLSLGDHLLPLFVSVHGTGVTMWDGPPADVARNLEARGLATWQPIGNYPARAFPMWGSIMQGVAECDYQIKRFPGRRIWAMGYSQGAAVISLCMKYGELGKVTKDRRVATCGNPMREFGKANGNLASGVPVPEGAGAMVDRLVDTPDWWGDFAHGANSSFGRDLYTDTALDGWGENVRAITKIVMGNQWWSGTDNIFQQIAELGLNPAGEAGGVIKAILYSGMFFGARTGPHLNYDLDPMIRWFL